MIFDVDSLRLCVYKLWLELKRLRINLESKSMSGEHHATSHVHGKTAVTVIRNVIKKITSFENSWQDWWHFCVLRGLCLL